MAGTGWLPEARCRGRRDRITARRSCAGGWPTRRNRQAVEIGFRSSSSPVSTRRRDTARWPANGMSPLAASWRCSAARARAERKLTSCTAPRPMERSRPSSS